MIFDWAFLREVIRVELLSLAASIALVALWFWRRPRRLPFSTLARRPALAGAAVAAAALAVCLATVAVRGVPGPVIHDEYSYLLASDTFAHGRLTNPPHPMWHHFESFHILQQPTYQSKYPPAQGLVLAAGQIIGGHPIAGVWLSLVLACLCLYWMLGAWLPARWACAASLAVAARLALTYWAHSYWGGAIAMAAGALLFGGLKRLLDKPRERDWRPSLALGAGAAVLALTRPYEGLAIALPAAGLLVWRRPGFRALVPAFVALGVGILFLGYYNYRVTGDAFLFPYTAYERAYTMTPSFVWGTVRPAPEIHNAVMQQWAEGWHLDQIRRQSSLGGFIDETMTKIAWKLWAFYIGVALTIPWLLMLRRSASRNEKLALGILLFFLASLLVETRLHPHYAAPGAALAVFVAAQGLRRLAAWRPRGVRAGRVLAGGMALAAILAPLHVMPFHFGLLPRHQERHLERPTIEGRLRAQGGRHLVLVSYSENHSVHREWVYNGADIDGAPVVWARSLSPAEDARLVDYFNGRRIWTVHADRQPPALEEVRPPK